VQPPEWNADSGTSAFPYADRGWSLREGLQREEVNALNLCWIGVEMEWTCQSCDDRHDSSVGSGHIQWGCCAENGHELGCNTNLLSSFPQVGSPGTELEFAL